MLGKKSHSLHLCLVLTLLLLTDAVGNIRVSPRYLFVTPATRSIPVTVTNPGNNTIEVWVKFKFGEVTSDDSGKTVIIYDSTAHHPESAAEWLKVYPERFKLEPMGSQVVRITATPPPGLSDGEYWARIMVASQEAKTPNLQNPTSPPKTGIVFIQQVGVPYHYRKGNLKTGLEVTNLNIESRSDSMVLSFDMNRKGNASYWGTAIIHLYNDEKKLVFSHTKDVVVYRRYNPKIFLDRKSLPQGTYNLEIEFRTDKRSDVPYGNIIHDQPFRVTKSITLN